MYWATQVSPSLQAQDYTSVINFYEESIALDPENINNFWLLGLAYLLADREEEAKATWLSVISQVDNLNELVEILEAEATNQKSKEQLENSLLIREYIREVEPELFNNQLHIVLLKSKLEKLDADEIEQAVELFNDGFDLALLRETLGEILKYPDPTVLDLVRKSLAYLDQGFLEQVEELTTLKNQKQNIFYYIELIELSLQLKQDHLNLLNTLSQQYWKINNYQKAEDTIVEFIKYCPFLDLQLYGNSFYLYVLLRQSKWSKIESVSKTYKILLEQFEQKPPEQLQQLSMQLLPLVAMPLLYLEDNPKKNRLLQNRLSFVFQNELRKTANLEKNANFNHHKKSKTLKIGYLASTLKRHSVGWLSRWLFHYHDREKLEINLYLFNQVEDEITRDWFYKNSDAHYLFGEDPFSIAEQIFADKVDILVDLDSLSSSTACQVMALKPAPIQITWLGMDSTGIPNVDYFIVDPHVVPKDAQQYYQEKLWRLPQTYLAVDGFEVAAPTMRKRDLPIADNAITYLTSQMGFKHHPETIKLQLKIIKQVPNSYLLIKGRLDSNTVEEHYLQLAQQEGIDRERLIFLPEYPSEEIQRANLPIADVFLDTYPYSGATTTLEVLWMGIPIVTQVGQQFASRNSYTFMLNAGLSEGIAFSPQEYIDWAVKLGTSEDLRSKIHWKLLKGRRTSPLWNAKQFTKDMEQAYFEMASRNL